MRGPESSHIPILVLALTLMLLGGHAAPSPAFADEPPYVSARDCMRSVAEVENRRERQEDELSAKARSLIAMARDLCIQSRYDEVQKLLGNVAQMAESD
ncbi:hypothetical protein [Dongia deserti]|uniref:hypothetical protein n=1 Tax=Dongia deserti TaxID=2268030 RepID=UPI0013C485CC|nr:hypothetical protein [Dongia deserti]